MEQKKWNRYDRSTPLRREQEPSEATEKMLEGRNAVQEALAAGRPIDKLYIAAGETDRVALIRRDNVPGRMNAVEGVEGIAKSF